METHEIILLAFIFLIALPSCVILGITLLKDKIYDKKMRRMYENSEEYTNIKLRAEIAERMRNKLTPDIDIVLHRYEDIFDYLHTLYATRKSNIPIYNWMIDGLNAEKRNLKVYKYKSGFGVEEDENTMSKNYESVARQSWKHWDFYLKFPKDTPTIEVETALNEYFDNLGEEEINRRYKIFWDGIYKYDYNDDSEFLQQKNFERAFGADCQPFPIKPPKEIYNSYRRSRKRMYEELLMGSESSRILKMDKESYLNNADNFFFDILRFLINFGREIYK